MSTEIQKYERPGLMERIGNALKALTVPHPKGGYNSVPVYSSWSSWDAALSARYAGSDQDFGQLAGDLSQSSLIMSGVRWLGNVLPGARLTVQETKDGSDEEILDHRLPKLWYRPNKHYSGSTLMKGFAYSWILSGNAYQIKVWNKAKTEVVELWYEPHWSIRPRWRDDNQGSYISGDDDPEAFITYYEVDRGEKKYRLETDQVIHFRDGFDPQNIRLGLSRVGAILREIYGDNEAANYASRLAGGSGVPPFILTLDKELDVDQQTIDGLENSLYRKTTGDKRGRPMVVTGGKVERLGVDPDKMDLRNSHRFSEERFSAVTGIPAVALELGAGHEHSIYNNVKQADERAYEAYLLPLYSHIEEELNVQLLEDYEGEASARFCKFDLSQIRALQEDLDAVHKRVWGDFTNKVIDMAEARAQLNYEVRDEHKGVFYVPQGGGPTEAPAEPEPLRLVKAEQNGHQDGETKGKRDTPSEDEIEEASGWWRKNAPDEAKDLIDSKREAKNIHIAYRMKNVEETPADAVVQISVTKNNGTAK